MDDKNIVFVAKSLDGYIAGVNGELDWLDSVPNPDGESMGFVELMDEVDAVVMGKTTFETVISFSGEWPYVKPVFVLSSSLKKVPEKIKDKVYLLSGDLDEVLRIIHSKGFYKLYIDGGKVVQSFLKKDLIHELRIATMPILLGGGVSLFGVLPDLLKYKHLKTEVFLGQIVQSHYGRVQ